jgi:protein TonB
MRCGLTRHYQRLEAREPAYPLRILFSLAFTLALCLILTRLPWYLKPQPIGWQLVEKDRLLALIATQLEARAAEDAGVPITRFAAPTTEAKNEGKRDSSEFQAQPLQRVSEPPSRLEAIEAILEHAEKPPQIVGGLGAYYIHIEYPEEAIRAGIEGQLVLRFVVEKDGTPTHIRVIKSLHPLCDSAAVAALRRTRFIPGMQNGQPVRVHMQLPVRFRLIPNPAESSNPDH